MSSIARVLVLGAAVCAGAHLPTVAQSQGDQASSPTPPLFASNDLLEVTLVANFDALEDDRGETSPSRPAVLRFPGLDGAPTQLDILVRTRGYFRLRRSTCGFPNLRLEFPDSAAAERTIFAGQDKLKLVAHCRDSREFEQNTLEEYLVYRLYNVVTDTSFRVRLLRVTYEDVNGRKAPITRYGFLLEHPDGLAERVRGVAVEANAIDPLDLDPTASARLELFQYMVGNTDFSVVLSHNSELLVLPDGSYQAIPYDFDFSGLVDARYAFPDTLLGTRSVRERVYRGFCRPGIDTTAMYVFLSERRLRFEEVFRQQPELDARAAERAIRYLNDFFETIDSPRALSNLLERRCRAVPG